MDAYMTIEDVARSLRVSVPTVLPELVGREVERWSRLGESNPGPTHYELQAPRPWTHVPGHDQSTDLCVRPWLSGI
jgi:hypothetical protein